MTRVAVVAAGVAAGLVAVGSASHLASPPLAVTVRVAVERPATRLLQRGVQSCGRCIQASLQTGPSSAASE